MFIRLLCLLILWSGVSSVLAAEHEWRLTIDGHHRFVFGDRVLHGYVQIPWQVIIDFTTSDGSFVAGAGSARWLDKVSSGSRPQGWIECHLEEGSYLDAGLHMQRMPRVRFAKFPVVGALEDGVLRIAPGYAPPGNYLAIRFGCQSDAPAAHNWFVFATRSRNEEGKRQDAETREQEPHREAVIREVKALPPEGELTLPLQDGWFFQQGKADSDYYAEYRLQRR